MNKLDDTLQFHQTALSLRAARQQLLASNIANADTPNYKARDINFADSLRTALAGRQQDLPLAKTTEQHLDGATGESLLGAPVFYRKPVQPSADGNTVDMDVERAQFADNALRYEASVHFVSKKLQGILSAIQGQ